MTGTVVVVVGGIRVVVVVVVVVTTDGIVVIGAGIVTGTTAELDVRFVAAVVVGTSCRTDESAMTTGLVRVAWRDGVADGPPAGSNPASADGNRP